MWIKKLGLVLLTVVLISTSGLASQRLPAGTSSKQQPAKEAVQLPVKPNSKQEPVKGVVRLAAEPSSKQQPAREVIHFSSNYVLGPDDQITIVAVDAEEISGKPFRIDSNGTINLPLVGRLIASGLTIEHFEAELNSRLKTYIQEPHVVVSIAESRSQPISVLGAVNNPGIHQLQGHKTLFEVLSMAGGLRGDAGHSVKITRRLEWGRIPLPNAADDPSGNFSIAAVNHKAIMDAKNPQENILIQPEDVISVPRADMVYVVGEVNTSGGFVLNERENISVLQALSLAGGVGKTAAAKSARILRPTPGSDKRAEIPVDLKKILAGKATDVPLQSDDILFVPTSPTRSAVARTLEAAVQSVPWLIIYRIAY